MSKKSLIFKLILEQKLTKLPLLHIAQPTLEKKLERATLDLNHVTLSINGCIFGYGSLLRIDGKWALRVTQLGK